jgi:hypothetical protein
MRNISSKLAFLFAGFVLAIATMAVAQSYDPEIGGANVGAAYMVQPDGSTVRFGGRHATVNDIGDQAIMSHAEELPEGSILYRKGNKLHALKNQMINGKMCPEWEKTWTQQ